MDTNPALDLVAVLQECHIGRNYSKMAKILKKKEKPANLHKRDLVALRLDLILNNIHPEDSRALIPDPNGVFSFFSQDRRAKEQVYRDFFTAAQELKNEIPAKIMMAHMYLRCRNYGKVTELIANYPEQSLKALSANGGIKTVEYVEANYLVFMDNLTRADISFIRDKPEETISHLSGLFNLLLLEYEYIAVPLMLHLIVSVFVKLALAYAHQNDHINALKTTHFYISKKIPLGLSHRIKHLLIYFFLLEKTQSHWSFVMRFSSQSLQEVASKSLNEELAHVLVTILLEKENVTLSLENTRPELINALLELVISRLSRLNLIGLLTSYLHRLLSVALVPLALYEALSLCYLHTQKTLEFSKIASRCLQIKSDDPYIKLKYALYLIPDISSLPRAIAILTDLDATNLDPSFRAVVYRHLAYAYWTLHNRSETGRAQLKKKMASYLDKALNIEPSSWKTLSFLGLHSLMDAHIDKAAEYTLEALKRTTCVFSTWHLLALIKSAKKDGIGALKICAHAIENFSLFYNKIFVTNALLLCNYVSEKQALDFLQHLFLSSISDAEDVPNSSGLELKRWILAAEIFLSFGNHADTEVALKEAKTISKHPNTGLMIIEAEYQKAIGNNDAATRLMENVYISDPLSTRAIQFLIGSNLERGETAVARSLCDKLLEINPHDPVAYYYRSQQTEDPTLALEFIQKARDLERIMPIVSVDIIQAADFL